MSLRAQQRGDPAAYGLGLQDLFAGVRSDDADAAARNFADVLILTHKYFTGEK